MLDLDKAIMLIDAHLNCSRRVCDACQSMFGIDNCPQSEFRDQFEEMLRILEIARDRLNKSQIDVTETDIINLFGE